MKDGEDYLQVGERTLRKGTVAAYSANIKSLQSLINDGVGRDDACYQKIIQDMAALTEDLKALNYFDVFGIEGVGVSTAAKRLRELSTVWTTEI